MLDPNYPSPATTNIDTGLYFERGVARAVTDEQAAILLAVHENPYFEGTEEHVQDLRKMHNDYRIGTVNHLLGKRKNPEFILVDDSKPSETAAPLTDTKPSAASDKPAA